MNDSELYSFFRHLSGNLSSNLSLNLSSNLSLTLSQNSYSNYLQNYLQISFQFWWMIRPIQSHIYSFQIRPKCSYLRFVKLRSFIFPYEYIKSIYQTFHMVSFLSAFSTLGFKINIPLGSYPWLTDQHTIASIYKYF